MRGEARKRAVERVVETCFLGNVMHQSVETLSKGYRHRTCFAQSIIHDPEILVMDEPTDGLDPNQKHEVRQLIRRMGQTKAIIFSTHILEEVDAACTRAIIIDRGQIVANGTPAELRGRSDLTGAVTVRVAGALPGAVREKVEGLPAVRKALVLEEADGRGRVRAFPAVSTRSGDLARSLGDLAVREGWKLEELHTEEGRLDEVFRSITRPDTVRES
jgi:ABC-2 type transport system ATP-binding protein